MDKHDARQLISAAKDTSRIAKEHFAKHRETYRKIAATDMDTAQILSEHIRIIASLLNTNSHIIEIIANESIIDGLAIPDDITALADKEDPDDTTT